MNPIFIGTKIILKTPFGKMQRVGAMFEVGNITESNIVIRDVKTKIAICAIDIEDFNEYFDIFVGMRKWSDWQAVIPPTGQITGMYRTNGKKVEVKVSNVKGVASCNFSDTFNLMFGIRLAYARCMEKILVKRITSDGENLRCVKEEIDTLIKSLDKKTK